MPQPSPGDSSHGLPLGTPARSSSSHRQFRIQGDCMNNTPTLRQAEIEGVRCREEQTTAFKRVAITEQTFPLDCPKAAHPPDVSQHLAGGFLQITVAVTVPKYLPRRKMLRSPANGPLRHRHATDLDSTLLPTFSIHNDVRIWRKLAAVSRREH